MLISLIYNWKNMKFYIGILGLFWSVLNFAVKTHVKTAVFGTCG